MKCWRVVVSNDYEYIVFDKDRKWKHGDDTTSKLRAMKLCTVKRRVGNFKKLEVYVEESQVQVRLI
jgi:hypothetical protein